MADYATLAEVKSIIGLHDAADDARLSTLITAASRAIDAWCQRRFDAVSGTRRYTAYLPREVEIDDVLNVATVELDTDGDGRAETVLAATDYLLWPLNAHGEPYTKILLRPHAPVSLPRIPGGVAVTGTFGYSTSPPAPIAEACRLLVVRLYRRPQAPFGVIEPTIDGAAAAEIRADHDVQELLNPYRRNRGWVLV